MQDTRKLMRVSVKPKAATTTNATSSQNIAEKDSFKQASKISFQRI